MDRQYKCRFCGETVDESEVKMWFHIQAHHPEEHKKARGLKTPDMVAECFALADAKYSSKIPLVTSRFVRVMLGSMKKGDIVNWNGDRVSEYFPIAVGRGDLSDRVVSAALVEEKEGIPQDGQGYAIHVINDVDYSGCQTFQTDHLDEKELAQLMDDILKKLSEGYL